MGRPRSDAGRVLDIQGRRRNYGGTWDADTFK